MSVPRVPRRRNRDAGSCAAPVRRDHCTTTFPPRGVVCGRVCRVGSPGAPGDSTLLCVSCCRVDGALLDVLDHFLGTLLTRRPGGVHPHRGWMPLERGAVPLRRAGRPLPPRFAGCLRRRELNRGPGADLRRRRLRVRRAGHAAPPLPAKGADTARFWSCLPTGKCTCLGYRHYQVDGMPRAGAAAAARATLSSGFRGAAPGQPSSRLFLPHRPSRTVPQDGCLVLAIAGAPERVIHSGYPVPPGRFPSRRAGGDRRRAPFLAFSALGGRGSRRAGDDGGVAPGAGAIDLLLPLESQRTARRMLEVLPSTLDRGICSWRSDDLREPPAASLSDPASPAAAVPAPRAVTAVSSPAGLLQKDR